MRNITRIIVHCTATPVESRVTVADIDRWHRQRGFNSIGYHYVIYQDGSVHPGRPVEAIGAHCRGYNATSIGIAYVGGVAADRRTPLDTRTPAQRTALRQLIADLQKRFPGTTVHPHSEFATKACPSFRIPEEL